MYTSKRRACLGIAHIFVLILVFGFFTIPLVTHAALASFEGGAVSLTFDDGWLSTHENAVPLLNEKGFKGTFYIYSDAMFGASQAENAWEGFMNITQIVGLENSGHEIGAHSRTHSDLSGDVNLESEIAGSKSDLLGVGVNSVVTFAYPFGVYNEEIIESLQGAGFVGARTTDDDVGYNDENSNPFTLQIKHITENTTANDVEGWIDEARQGNKWLVIMFHEVTGSPAECLGGDDECASTALVENMVEYLSTTDTCVLTVAAALDGTRCGSSPPPPPPPTEEPPPAEEPPAEEPPAEEPPAQEPPQEEPPVEEPPAPPPPTTEPPSRERESLRDEQPPRSVRSAR